MAGLTLMADARSTPMLELSAPAWIGSYMWLYTGIFTSSQQHFLFLFVFV